VEKQIKLGIVTRVARFFLVKETKMEKNVPTWPKITQKMYTNIAIKFQMKYARFFILMHSEIYQK
jgi:hypothetical protein